MRQMIVFIALLLCAFPKVEAQLIDISAKEAYPNALSFAKTAIAEDVYLVNIFFSAFEYSGIEVTMNLNTGKATGWMYSFYSSSKDTTQFLLAVKLPFIGIQVIAPPPGTSIPIPPIQGDMQFLEPWVDSPEALQGAKNGGADTFIQTHPDAKIEFVVALENPVENPIIPVGKYWVFTFRSPSTNETMTCVVNAETGISVSCGVINELKGIPEATGFRLDQNYPQPFSLSSRNQVLITFAVDSRQHVKLKVYDAFGRQIAALFDCVVDSGEHVTILETVDLKTPGVYFYRLETMKGAISRKMLVSR